MYKNPVEVIKMIRMQFESNSRPKPSSKLITNGSFLKQEDRIKLLDYCAYLVDKNPTNTGRSDMCIYFSCLLRYSLRLLGYKAEVHIGLANFNNNSQEFSWEHSWVMIDDVLIDGNADSMDENPYVPVEISPYSYWGTVDELPQGRAYVMKRKLLVSDELDELDDDYINWKVELKNYIKNEFL